MTFEQFLSNKINDFNSLNTKDLKENINSYSEKIDKFLETNYDLGLTKEDVVNQIIIGNPYAIAAIRKAPGRQNVSEKAFFEYLGIEKSPAGGKKAVRFDSNGDFANNKWASTKSADFVLKDENDNLVFGTQKFIKESGGAQDNQIEDAKKFAECCGKKHKAIIAIDGDYGKSILKNTNFNNDNIQVLTTDEIMVKLSNGELKKYTTFYD